MNESLTNRRILFWQTSILLILHFHRVNSLFFFLFQNSEISLFETNIRFMGSLLACYALTGDVMFRDKAAQLGERMLPAFQTETGIPHSLINLHTGVSWRIYAVYLPVLIISPSPSSQIYSRNKFEGRGFTTISFLLPPLFLLCRGFSSFRSKAPLNLAWLTAEWIGIGI